jgi:acyl-CoA synthetase (AMP-forming)/AMP-acid ligase II
MRLVESLEPRLPRLRAVVALSGGHPRWPAYHEWREAESAATRGPEGGEDDDFIQLYTSGTTGHPKGVCHTHAIWRRFAEACRAAEWGRYDPATVALVCMPVFHVAGFNCTNLTLLGGGCAVITRKVDPSEILELLARHRITDTLFVPAIILALTAHPRAAQTDFGALRTVSYGAAPIAPDLLDRARRLFGCGFVHLYGLTENLGGATYLPPDQHREELGKLRSVGRPYEGLELRVVDESDRDLPRGQVGEIVLRCPWTMRGYWRNERATAEALRGGWLHTGDAGSLDHDGYLYILDRVKDMIITGGENVYPAEVEAALFGHPAVADVAVIGVPDERWGEAVKALVVVQTGATLDVEDLLRFVRTRIAGYKVPKSVEAIAELPRNASGKVLRRVLREPYWRGRERNVH